MKKYSLGYSFMFSAIFSVLFFSCSKQTPTANNTNTGGTGTGTGVTVPGTVASYETIPIPGVNIAGKIGALPTQFYCTNIGPYVNVFNGNSRSNVIYKYRGGTGSDAWISYSADTYLFTMMPANLYNEDADAVSYTWCSADPNFDYAYGENNLGTGSPSFKFHLKGQDGDTTQPYAFNNVFQSQGSIKIWATWGNEVWYERANSQDFELFIRLPDDEFLFNGFLDPNTEGILWCWGYSKIYKFDLSTHQYNSWDFSSLGAGYATCITQADGTIYAEYSNNVLALNGTQFSIIGKLSISLTQTSWTTIASNGNIIFASDGTYYDKGSGSWKSYIGDGLNLTSSDANFYTQLKQYAANGYPIAATQGSGPVYILLGEQMLKIYPKF
jgi:hypothetical protein